MLLQNFSELFLWLVLAVLCLAPSYARKSMGIFEGMEKKKKALEAQLLDIYKHVQFWMASFNFCVNTTFENPFFEH